MIYWSYIASQWIAKRGLGHILTNSHHETVTKKRNIRNTKNRTSKCYVRHCDAKAGIVNECAAQYAVYYRTIGAVPSTSINLQVIGQLHRSFLHSANYKLVILSKTPRLLCSSNCTPQWTSEKWLQALFYSHRLFLNALLSPADNGICFQSMLQSWSCPLFSHSSNVFQMVCQKGTETPQ